MNFKRVDTDKLARNMLVLSVLMATFGYGVVAEHFGLFPVTWMKSANAAVEAMLEDTGTRLPWYYVRSPRVNPTSIHAREAMAPGLTLVSGVARNDESWARVVDATGRTIHGWRLNWFDIWPNPTHIPADDLPKSNGGLVHGIALLRNGDLVFNFSELGLVRLDACGKVVWKLPYRTHHSIFRDEEGNFWVPGMITRDERSELLPNYQPPFADYTLLKVSPDGRILEEHSVSELLLKNGLRGLLHMSSIANRNTIVSGDTLHLNYVEIFPSTLPAGVFKPGDVLVSLRNINAIIVFDPRDWHVKFTSIGALLRQHDPHFVDGNTISVIDNNNLGRWTKNESRPDAAGHYSRIATVSAQTGKVETLYTGTRERPFFTDIMGQHQLLPNGNVLVTESIAGRVFEIDHAGNVVWEYFNVIDEGLLGAVDDAHRLSGNLDEAFFSRISSTCKTSFSTLEH
jgi:hypothetical protein